MDASAKSRILLVDDEKHLLVSLREFLVSEKFDVVTARSGEEALQVLETTKPDLIILDISMPGMGGLGFLRRVSLPDGKTKYPVLVLTARTTMEDFFGSIDVDGFLKKPCSQDELAKKVREILAAHRDAATKPAVSTRRKVLLADDDEKMLRATGDALIRAGCEVDTIRTGPEILERASSVRPDVILAKEILPRLNGSAAASLLQVMPSVSTIPVIIYDPRPDMTEDQHRRIGEIKCVRKVLNTAEPALLVKAVEEILSMRSPAT